MTGSAAFPLPDPTWAPLAPFWQAAARHELALPRCDACSRLCWYPEEQCPACGSSGFTWSAVSGRGTLFSWTVVRHAFVPQYAPILPFATGLVALDEDPAVRLVTRVVDCELDELAPGMAMEVVFRPLSFAGVEGEVTAPFFCPAAAGR
jgi:uncharacterized OB-fold protein